MRILSIRLTSYAFAIAMLCISVAHATPREDISLLPKYGLQEKNAAQKAARFRDAWARFAHIHEKAPGRMQNLQNWAITLYYAGDYAQAWQKIELAESTPDGAGVYPNFVAALQQEMPRP